MKASSLETSSYDRGAQINRNVSYMIPYDLGVTFGTIYENFMKWIKNDFKKVVKFNSEYIKTRITSDKEFLWNKGILAQARTPCLAMQCSIDHSFDSEVFRHPSVKNWEAIGFLEPSEFTQPFIAVEDNLDMSNNIEFAFSLKAIRMELFAGITAGSRFQADNLANFWTTRRSDNYYYDFPMVIDFKIPDEVIYILAEKFKLDLSDWRTVLKWLNRHSRVHIYYAMDGYNGKYYYFLRYNANPLIRVNDLSNPTEFDVQGELKGEAYGLSRSFDLEVLVPSIISISKYGDRIDLEDVQNKVLKGVFPVDTSKAHTDLQERFVEIERVFTEKHAYKEINFSWTEDDLETLPDGKVVTKELDLMPFLKNDEEGNPEEFMELFLKWMKVKGYKLQDVFNFQLYEYQEDWRKDPKRNSIDINGKEPDNSIYIPDEKDEYRFYIKNMAKMTIRDTKPRVGVLMTGIFYIDLLVKKQFDYYLKPEAHSSFGNDDLGNRLPYGKSKVNKPNDYI